MDKNVVVSEMEIRNLQAKSELWQAGFAISLVVVVILTVGIFGQNIGYSAELSTARNIEKGMTELYKREVKENQRMFKELSDLKFGDSHTCPEVDLKKSAPKRAYIIRT